MKVEISDVLNSRNQAFLLEVIWGEKIVADNTVQSSKLVHNKQANKAENVDF